jgi:hypothetical protein
MPMPTTASVRPAPVPVNSTDTALIPHRGYRGTAWRDDDTTT